MVREPELCLLWLQVDLLHLAPGVDLWGKLIEHEQPGIDCFSAFVKLPISSEHPFETALLRFLELFILHR